MGTVAGLAGTALAAGGGASGLAATAATSAVGAGASALAQGALRDDPPPLPSVGGQRVDLGTGLRAVDAPRGVEIEEGDRAQQVRERREQMIDDLWQSIGVDDQERMAQFERAKQAFLDQTEAELQPQFEQQRESLEARQERAGTSLSTIGRQERGAMEERIGEVRAQNVRQAEQMARDLQAQETQRRLGLLDLAQQQQQQDFNRRINLANIARGEEAQAFERERIRRGIAARETARDNQMRFSALGAGARLGGFVGQRFFGGQQPGNQPAPSLMDTPASVREGQPFVYQPPGPG